MSPGEAVPSPRPAPWKRPWVRRITYLLATGGVLAGIAAWTVRRPFVTAWVLKELDRAVRAETGLPLEVGDLEISLLSGRVVLKRIAWGGDLVRADRVEAVADFWSLLGSRPHLHRLAIEAPRLRISRAALERIKLRTRPPSRTPVKLLLDDLAFTSGLCELDGAAWNLPAARFEFRVQARGRGPNRVLASLQVERIGLQSGPHLLQGQGRLEADLSDTALGIKALELQLGRSRLALAGSLDLKGGETQPVKASGEARLDLDELSRLASAGTAAGVMDLGLRVSGTLAAPAVALEAVGRDLALPALPLQPGSLRLKAAAEPNRVQVTSLDWESADGQFHADGDWRRGGTLRLRASAERVELGAVAEYVRVGFLREFQAAFQAEATLPSGSAFPPRLDRIQASARLDLQRHGQPAGRAALDLKDGRLEVADLDLKAPEIDLSGKGALLLDGSGFSGLQGSGRVRTEAAEVAKVLKAWNVVGLDMGGRVDGRASASWSRAQGLQLDGTGEVLAPRWQKARADRVVSDVRIRGSQLWVERTELVKGDGRAWGELWLDWGVVKPGADTLDLCYRAHHLPVAEGLKAADDGRNGIGDLPISGLGSAWVRIHGDWDRLRLTGEGLLEEGRAYGLRLPAGRASLDLDLAAERLRVPEFRIAESLAQLGEGGAGPEGFLALQGALDMDLKRSTWTGRLSGSVDSTLLELPGPRFQANLESRIEGPWTVSFGPLELPGGWATFSQGRLLVGDQSIEGLKGQLRLQDGRLEAEVSSAGHDHPLLRVAALQTGREVRGDLTLRISRDTGDTAHLARRLTGDLLLDAAADLRAEGTLDDRGLRWQGRVPELTGFFQGFTLSQTKPGQVSGGTAGARLDLSLQGAPSEAVAERSAKGPTASLQLTGEVPFSLDRPGDLKVKGTGELANLKTILDHLLDLENAAGLLAGLQPEGKATLDLRATGTYADPAVHGTLDLVDGRLRLRAYPQSVEGVIFTLRFKDKDILLTEEDPLIGTLAQGALGLWGRATWGMGGLASYDFSARLEEFLLRDVPQGFELQGSLEANLAGNDTGGGVLRGSLQADRAAYRADLSLRDLILGGSLGSTPELSGLDPDDPLQRIDLDLDLQLSQPWDIDTNLLKIKGRPEGSFKVLGTLARPGLKGRMEFLPGGRITNILPAGDLILERGNIHFVDPSVVNPSLTAEGRIDVPPYLVSLNINGTLDQLNFIPTSTPSLRQDEIVAILIDPAAAQNIGTSSAATSQASLNYGLASASSGLLATLAFANFGETLRKSLNLDRVNPVVRTGTTGTLESSLTIGKTFDLFGSRTPIIGTYSRSGNLVTLSGQVEWRFGNFVLQFGASSEGSGINPKGEIRHTWSPR